MKLTEHIMNAHDPAMAQVTCSWLLKKTDSMQRTTRSSSRVKLLIPASDATAVALANIWRAVLYLWFRKPRRFKKVSENYIKLMNLLDIFHLVIAPAKKQIWPAHNNFFAPWQSTFLTLKFFPQQVLLLCFLLAHRVFVFHNSDW